jgi:molybdopterin-containing oxidoreductase family iron-sulfur binding subunit
MRYGMAIDLYRCVGCQACTAACKLENATPPGIFWTKVINSETGRFPNVKQVFQPVLCMHCGDAPCVDVCPTGATMKMDNGVVTVDPELCIGCRYCMVACPYDARSFNYGEPEEYFTGMGYTPFEESRKTEHKSGVVGKCDFCMDRVASGEEPACVLACISGARIFGDLDDPDSEVSRLVASRGAYQLHAELGTDPSVYYLPG